MLADANQGDLSVVIVAGTGVALVDIAHQSGSLLPAVGAQHRSRNS